VLAYPGCPGKKAVKRMCVCVCSVVRLLLLLLQLHYGPLSGTTRVSQYQKKHSLTPILIINSPLSASSIYYDPQHPPCSIHVPDSLFAQPLFKATLVYLLVWLLQTSCISSLNHCLLFATHANTIATCFAVVPKLCYLILVSLSTHYLELYLLP